MSAASRTQASLLLAFAMALPFLFWNCSSPFQPYVNTDGGTVIASDASGNVSVTAGASGIVQPLQDRAFSVTPSTSDPGPFTVMGLPAWATFNLATGKVSGVATLISAAETFTITGSKPQNVFGPYTVRVIGNPLKEFQWHLSNTGQKSFALGAGVPGEDMHIAATIRAGYTGAGVRIAVSDTGVVSSHEAIRANVLTSEARNYLQDFAKIGTWSGDSTPDLTKPEQAHGTAVAGLAAEKGWNGAGGRGMAPEAHFASFLFVQADANLRQSGYYVQATNDQFSGIFDIFNYSWGDPQCELLEYPSSTIDKLKAAVFQQRGGRGSILVMAGGNAFFEDIQTCFPNLASAKVFGNSNFSELQTTPYILQIAAVNAVGVSASYSTPGSNLWVSAAGGEFGADLKPQGGSPTDTDPAIIAPDFTGCNSGKKTEGAKVSGFDRGNAPNTACNYLNTMNGTSAAAPIATGAIALILQANPLLTWRDVKYILAKTADQVEPNVNPATHPDASLNLSGHTYDLPWITNAAGFHFQNYYGFGRINVDRAVALAQNYTSSLGTFTQTNWSHDSGVIRVDIPDANPAGTTQSLSVGQNLTIEAVQVRVSVNNCVGDLGLELTAPSGNRSVLLNINNRLMDTAISDHTFLTNAFYGEKTAGHWTLKVLDGHAGCTATLTNWKLNFAGY